VNCFTRQLHDKDNNPRYFIGFVFREAEACSASQAITGYCVVAREVTLKSGCVTKLAKLDEILTLIAP